MTDRIDPGVVGGVSSAEALAGAERMAEALRAAGWRVEPPTDSRSPRTGYYLPEGYREHVCQWARDNGLNPSDIPADARIEVTGGEITVDVFARTEDGKPIVAYNEVMRERITVPLRKPWSEVRPARQLDTDRSHPDS